MSKGMKVTANFKSNSKEVKEALHEAVEMGLEAVGLQAAGYAQLLCPVDTGRLRNSIVYTTAESGGSKGGLGEPARPEDMSPHSTPDKGTVVIGTNVEYAEIIELGGSKQAPKGYLNPAMQRHIKEYRQILEEVLKE